MPEPAAGVTLHAGPTDAVIGPAAGGRLVALRVDGVDLIKSTGMGPNGYGLYPMVPWAGRLRDGVLQWRGACHQLPVDMARPHAMHGTLVEAPWDVVGATDSTIELASRLRSPWPFGGRAVERFELGEDTLRISLSVETDGPEFPAIVGWHPWFPRQLRAPDGAPFGEPAELEFRAGGMLVRGADYLPTGEVARPIPAGPWDDCFVDVLGAPIVRWPGAFEVTIAADVPCWVCYTEPPDALCVEPQTGPPNGLNTGDAFVVGPGRPLVAAMTLRWRRLG